MLIATVSRPCAAGTGSRRCPSSGLSPANTASEDSDVDLLYELRPGARLGWEIDDLADELAEIFGRPVDLVSRVALHPLLAETVVGEARPLYAA